MEYNQNIENTVADKFASVEYTNFKTLITKASSDNSIVIKKNHLIYGKQKVEIPSFKTVEDVIKVLEAEKTILLLKYNDLYEKIIISESPSAYKLAYNNVVERIGVIDNKIDEVIAYISDYHTKEVILPSVLLQEKIEYNKQRALNIISSLKDDVHIEKNKANDLLKIHKQNSQMQQELEEIVNKPIKNYVIWKDENASPQNIKFESPKLRKTVKVVKVVKPMSKKATIQKKAKKALLEGGTY
jgi:hypothetical protein